MNRSLAGYLATLVTFVALDMLWLGFIAKDLYQQGIGHLMAERPRVSVAVVFYLMYAVGLMIFVLGPQAQTAGLGRSMLLGALFGLFAYATYDLSNLATLRQWPVQLTLVDIVWGTVLSAASAGAGKAAMDWAVKS